MNALRMAKLFRRLYANRKKLCRYDHCKLGGHIFKGEVHMAHSIRAYETFKSRVEDSARTGAWHTNIGILSVTRNTSSKTLTSKPKTEKCSRRNYKKVKGLKALTWTEKLIVEAAIASMVGDPMPQEIDVNASEQIPQ